MSETEFYHPIQMFARYHDNLSKDRKTLDNLEFTLVASCVYDLIPKPWDFTIIKEDDKLGHVYTVHDIPVLKLVATQTDGNALGGPIPDVIPKVHHAVELYQRMNDAVPLFLLNELVFTFFKTQALVSNRARCVMANEPGWIGYEISIPGFPTRLALYLNKAYYQFKTEQ